VRHLFTRFNYLTLDAHYTCLNKKHASSIKYSVPVVALVMPYSFPLTSLRTGSARDDKVDSQLSYVCTLHMG